jgi:NhaA family Na+:H+ antiporter
MTAEHARAGTDRPVSLPVAPVERWLAPVARFLHVESAGGIVLLACTAVALVLANSPFAAAFAAVWTTKIELTIGRFALTKTIDHLVINDGLMVIFFFVVGLEIKRELRDGELRDPRNAVLPVLGAVGGMIVPAAVYLALQWGRPGQGGWAIPMATDIAFVVGLLALFGPRFRSG